MKTIVNSLTVFFILTTTFSSFSQTTPDTTDKIYLSQTVDGDNTFKVLPLNPSLPRATFSHLWWSGDNAFSFAPMPIHNHRTPGSMPGSSVVVKMTDVVTESYGTGGPPPLTYTFTTPHNPTPLPKILGTDTLIHVQTYRNAVIDDTLYLIVTYANPVSDLLFDVKLTLDVGAYAEVWTQTLNKNRHFFPNGETWNAQTKIIDCPDMGPLEERSILIPVKINNTEEKELTMRVDFAHSQSANVGSAISYYSVNATVAKSHDPNVMIEHSNVNAQCDYRGGKIHYTVKFQNEGTGSTKYVRIVCHFDDKVDLNSIDNIKVPSFYQNGCAEDNNIKMRYVNCRSAIWSVDHSKRTLTIEMDHLILESMMDPNIPFLDRARDQIEFDILVKDNYLFGPPVLSYSEIFFDRNGAIVTNIAETGCVAPIPLDKGGGFQCEESFVCKYKWWILGGFALLLLLLIMLLARKNKREKTK